MSNLKIYGYTLELQTDSGVRTVKTTASCEKFAIHKVIQAENCPESAVKSIENTGEIASFVIK